MYKLEQQNCNHKSLMLPGKLLSLAKERWPRVKRGRRGLTKKLIAGLKSFTGKVKT